MKLPATERLSPVGHCIYGPAHSGPLSDEHIIPFALGGYLVLPQSSCKECAAETSRFEAAILRGGFRAFKEAIKLPSRTKERPKELPLFCVNGDENLKVMVPVEDYPLTLALPYFIGPYLARLPDTLYNQKEPWVFAAQIKLDVLAKNYGIESFGTVSVDSLAFARLLAKIALGLTVSYYGPSNVIPFVAEMIRQDCKYDYRRYIGSCDDARPPVDGDVTHEFFHRVAIADGVRLLVCQIRLFASLGAPSYHVIVGQLKDDFDRFREFPAAPDPVGVEAAAFWRLMVASGSTSDQTYRTFVPNSFGKITVDGREI